MQNATTGSNEDIVCATPPDPIGVIISRQFVHFRPGDPIVVHDHPRDAQIEPTREQIIGTAAPYASDHVEERRLRKIHGEPSRALLLSVQKCLPRDETRAIYLDIGA